MPVSSVMLYSKSEILENFADSSWQKKLFLEFDSIMLSRQRPFPCLYGVSGHKAGHLRFVFCETNSATCIAEALDLFIPKCRTFGVLTSLVIFEKPSDVQSIKYYHHKFWNLLNDVTMLDKSPLPKNIPNEIDHRYWEFCFHGEPIFVVCNTPAHVLRQSRRSNSFMLTFQPRWVFDKILGTPESTAIAFSAVKARLDKFDLVEKSPLLGKYGDKDVREMKQYFLADSNTELTCPFKALGNMAVSMEQLRFSKLPEEKPDYLDELVANFLPQQGAIEVQKDKPTKKHKWHSHETDETLVVLRGKMQFRYYDGKKNISKMCTSGDVIHLPKGVIHCSKASAEGATYLITTEARCPN